MSPRIEIAETHVSVHSSHHTPPGQASGGSLIIKLFLNHINCHIKSVYHCKAVVFAVVEFSAKSNILIVEGL
ncbi:hypothetical protein SD80_003395 [Scytonema tolypothrichoides VB-61278]|nr:hypothetical protein SD80_003395 [Scytonema tolypothrichoides VB-61278]